MNRNSTIGTVSITCGVWLSFLFPAASVARDAEPYRPPPPKIYLVAPTEPLRAEEQQKMFHLPPGFEIELVATEPEIRKPINLNFDARGRMYVTQSTEYPYPAADAAPKHDGIKVFADTDRDGRYDSVSTFAEGLNIPIGVTPAPGGAIAYSIPDIHRFHDEDADGKSDRREVLYGTFGFRDTHGMASSFRRWIDGWIYACHGFSNTSTIEGDDGEPVTMNSGNTYRFRLDGSHVEQFTHGQVNPFGLAFDPLGNLYSADCHSKPIYMLLRGAFYPSFGKPHDGLGFGPGMIEHSHGSTGICGVVYYAAEHFPAEYRDTVFIGNPVTGRVNHDRLEVHGSTYRAIEQPDFVACDDPWFRPVDIRLAPDGSIYIADFYNCIIGHYEVPLEHPRRDRERGRIWRVVYRGTDRNIPPPRPMPDLTALGLEGLLDRLADANIMVRTLATNEIVDRFGADAAEPLERLIDGPSEPTQRAHGLWALERTARVADALTSRLAGDADRAVRVHLMKMLGERDALESQHLEILRRALADEDAFVRRAAADALGRHPGIENLEPLLRLWSETPTDDTHLIHVTRIALRDHLASEGIYDSMPGALLEDRDAAMRLADVILGVRNEQAAAFTLARLSAQTYDTARLGEMIHHALRFAAEAQTDDVYELAGGFRDASPPTQAIVLRALRRAAQERGADLPELIDLWAIELGEQLLEADAAGDVRLGIELARDLRIQALHDELLRAASARARYTALRSEALDACVAVDAGGSIELLDEVLANAAEPIGLRSRAATALGAINSESTRRTLLEQLAVAPLRLSIAIAAALGSGRQGGEALLEAVEQGTASPRLLGEAQVANRLVAAGVPDAKQRIEQLTSGFPDQDERIEELIAARQKGYGNATTDAARGRAVFDKICAACHRLGGRGAKVGPDLDGIGNRGLERLLEDILDPNRNVDQAFRATVLTTADGRALTGLALGTEGNVLRLADAEGREVRIPLDEIDERSASRLSPMPANVPDLIGESEFYDLMEYLLSERGGRG